MVRKATILYIEDDAASRLLVDRTLRYAGYNVKTAESGLEGIDVARTEAVDLILTDINLPDITGRELTTMLRTDERFSNVPIVALTSSDYADQRDISMAAGINGYLMKPLDVEGLPEQIEFYLQGGKDSIDAQVLDDAKNRYTQEVVTRLESRIRELERRNKDLLKLDGIKDSFIQITAHELRTPLTLIYGYSRLLQDSPELQAALEQQPGNDTLLLGLVEAVERMQSIVNEILTVSRIMSDRIELSLTVVNLIDMVKTIVAKYDAATNERQITILLETEGFPKTLRGDNDMITLVIDNLVSNAIKYTPDGGKVTIKAVTDPTHAHISFIDTGIGIDPEELPLIFDSFHTGNDPQYHSTSKTAFAGGGLGLGLTICRGIIEAHGGMITAKSEKRDPETYPGSEFVVTLPLVAQPRVKSIKRPLS